MHFADFLHRYSEAVLQFSLQGEEQFLAQEQAFANTQNPAEQATLEAHCAKMLRFAKKNGKKYFVLFGIGQAPDLLHALYNALQPEVMLLVCEQLPALAQAKKHCLHTSKYTIPLLADSSQWAHLMLLAQCGVTSANASFFVNPYQSHQAQELCKQLHLFVTGVQPATVSDMPLAEEITVDCGIGAIIHPYDKGLKGFFNQIPVWVSQMHVVWHAGSEQEQQNPEYTQHLAEIQQQATTWCKVPIKHTVRALNNDFAAQRNAMLEQLHTTWVLYIDADERFTPQAWQKLVCLLNAQPEMCPEIGAWAFERRTFFPSPKQVRVGRGLWPDIQLRLFKKTEATRFIQPVHEKVIGLGGQLGLCSAVPLYHLSYLLKDAAAQKERLAVFDTARSKALQQSGVDTAVFHKVQEYPVVASSIFAKMFAANKKQLDIMVLQGQLS